jgi:cell division control protein 6
MICQLRILRAEQNRTSFKLEKLRSHLKDLPLVILLDEIDQIKHSEISTILYNFDSILNAGLICISDSTQALIELQERVRSRLNPYTVFFPRYSRRNLLEILTYRAEQALASGSWTRTALQRIASVAQGDARAGIRMLRRAAVLADHQRMDKITTRSLKGQIKAAKEARKTRILNNLTQDHRILYKIVKQQRQVLSGDLWQKYLQHCARLKRKPLASRTFSDYANRLVQAGLITSERARVKGKVRLFSMVS